jgi:hypothetical protein
VRLLREMEAIEFDTDDDEIQHIPLEDVEMLELPKELCPDLSENAENKSLPADLYVIQDKMVLDQNQAMDKMSDIICEGQEGRPKNKWGPVLVEPRPTKVPRDGRTIMEKAQDRKKKANLESTKGINKTLNPFFVLTTSEILEAAECVDVRLGNDQVDEGETVVEILDKERDIVVAFDKACQMCQDLSLDKVLKNDVLTWPGDDAPCRIEIFWNIRGYGAHYNLTG